MVAAWESLARLNGSADRCSCSDDQLNLVGCDCRAEQNLPVRCSGNGVYGCSQFLRTQVEIEGGQCASCEAMDDFNYVGSRHHY